MRAMGRWASLVLVVGGLWLAMDVARAGVAVRITAPPDRSDVPWRPPVMGTLSDPSARLWVVVHPIETSEYWVQPKVSVEADGTWSTVIYIGRAGRIDEGKGFEIVAFANPVGVLREGLVFGDWPMAEARSQRIEVVRK